MTKKADKRTARHRLDLKDPQRENIALELLGKKRRNKRRVGRYYIGRKFRIKRIREKRTQKKKKSSKGSGKPTMGLRRPKFYRER